MARDAVAEVRDRTDIVELVSQYVSLKRTGRNYKGLCPFHQEKTPSFVVFPDSGNFHCFGCGKGGDVFTFFMQIEHVEFREALAELAKRAGIELSTVPTVAPAVDAHRQRLIELNELAATFFSHILSRGRCGRSPACQPARALLGDHRSFRPWLRPGLLGCPPPLSRFPRDRSRAGRRGWSLAGPGLRRILRSLSQPAHVSHPQSRREGCRFRWTCARGCPTQVLEFAPNAGF
ncbi:MAG: hypothetical protein C4345_10445 [Chloroflexota bacterium]